MPLSLESKRLAGLLRTQKICEQRVSMKFTFHVSVFLSGDPAFPIAEELSFSAASASGIPAENSLEFFGTVD